MLTHDIHWCTQKLRASHARPAVIPADSFQYVGQLVILVRLLSCARALERYTCSIYLHIQIVDLNIHGLILNLLNSSAFFFSHSLVAIDLGGFIRINLTVEKHSWYFSMKGFVFPRDEMKTRPIFYDFIPFYLFSQ